MYAHAYQMSCAQAVQVSRSPQASLLPRNIVIFNQPKSFIPLGIRYGVGIKNQFKGKTVESSQRTVRLQSSKDAYIGSVLGNGMKFAVVVARFNDLVTKLLLEGALEHFERHGVDRSDVHVAWVPGSFELPVVAKAMAKSGAFDGVVALGVVVRGATAHYDAVVAGATSGILNASTDSGVPVVFGVLTCDTMEQALDRAGGKVGNKGGEAAVTAIETANLLKTLRSEGKAAGPW